MADARGSYFVSRRAKAVDVFNRRFVDTVRGRFEVRTGGGLMSSGFSRYTMDRGAVDREACFARGAGRSYSRGWGRSSSMCTSSNMISRLVLIAVG